MAASTVRTRLRRHRCRVTSRRLPAAISALGRASARPNPNWFVRSARANTGRSACGRLDADFVDSRQRGGRLGRPRRRGCWSGSHSKSRPSAGRWSSCELDGRASSDLPLVDGADGSFYFKGEGDNSVWLSPHDEIASDPCDAAPRGNRHRDRDRPLRAGRRLADRAGRAKLGGARGASRPIGCRFTDSIPTSPDFSGAPGRAGSEFRPRPRRRSWLRHCFCDENPHVTSRISIRRCSRRVDSPDE